MANLKNILEKHIEFTEFDDPEEEEEEEEEEDPDEDVSTMTIVVEENEECSEEEENELLNFHKLKPKRKLQSSSTNLQTVVSNLVETDVSDSE